MSKTPKTAGSNPPSNAPSNMPSDPQSNPPSDLPTNPPSNLSSALLPQNAGNAAAVPRTDHAPPATPMPMLGQPIPGMKPFHELINLFPELCAEEKKKLRADIQKHGLLEPITIWDGKIIDGRHRAMACQELGIEPKYAEYTGNDPIGFVVSKNAFRRHLTLSQLAMLAVKLAGLSKGRPDLNASAFSQDEAAERLGVSKRLLQFAQKVHTDAIPEVAALVEAGTLTVDKGAALAKATPEQQRDAVAAVERGDKLPTFKTQEKASKEVSLEDQLCDQVKTALAHSKDSPERSDVLIEHFKTFCDEAFAKKGPREEFLQGILAVCAEYGVQLPTATAER